MTGSKSLQPAKCSSSHVTHKLCSSMQHSPKWYDMSSMVSPRARVKVPGKTGRGSVQQQQ
jgi:hypothetical protein